MKPFLHHVALVFAASALFAPTYADNAQREPVVPAAEVARVIGPIENTITKLGARTWATTDAPLMGNGDMGVCLVGKPEKMEFILCKNDFWRLQNGYSLGSGQPFGILRVNAAALKDAKVNITQRPADASTTGTFTLADGSALEVATFVAATEDILVMRLTAKGKPLDTEVLFEPEACRFKDERETVAEDGLTRITRHFTKDVVEPTGASGAMRLDGTKGPKITLTPGHPVTVFIALKSSFESAKHAEEIIPMVKRADAVKLLAAHQAWWTGFWSRSLVDIADPELMRLYYTPQYVMGSASRNPKFPPGISGPWITAGGGDSFAFGGYWTNYNHAAPFYGLYSSNHIEQADPHDAPLLDFMDKGREYAKAVLGIRGFLYPVGIGPRGYDITSYYDKLKAPNMEGPGVVTWGQRSNSAYNLVNMGVRWRSTLDRDYAKKIRPYVLGVVDFWEDYLILEGDRYVINKESVHEGSGTDKNPVSTLGFVRNAFRLALDMSEEIGTDADRRAKWKDILARLSDYPIGEENGKPIFILAEKGTRMWVSNTVNIQHIYPAGQLGLDSDPKLLGIARNTLEAYPRWYDHNGSNSFLPMAARIGYDPKIVLERLRGYPMGPNGFFAGNLHGIENCSTVPNTLNEMLLQSHEGVLRFFPVWPKDKDAAFTQLRAYGAFLVSARLKSGVVSGVSIRSEKGRDCVVLNPWPGTTVSITRDGKPGETVSGERFTLKTKPGETLELQAR